MRPSREFLGPRLPDRREFALSIPLLGGAAAGMLSAEQPPPSETEATVALIQGAERLAAVRTAWELLGKPDLGTTEIYLKGSYGSDSHFPATTHPETLRAIVRILRESGCRRLVLVERSGMGTTRQVWDSLGVTDLARQLEIELLALDDLAPAGWIARDLAGSHWKRGLEVPALLTKEAVSVQFSNLKAHRFGAHYSGSLKNALGVVSKRSHSGQDHNFMLELHESADQRLMIAEASQVFHPRVSFMDAVQVFVTEGPERGEVADPGVITASSDRVALDAIGLAILRLYGARIPGSRRNIFEQDQIKRAAELGLGVKDPEQIRFVTPDTRSQAMAIRLKTLISNVDRGRTTVSR